MGSHADGDGCTGQDEHLMRAGYALDGDDGCIADARHHAVAFLDQAHADHHLPAPARARDLTQLVVSELVTNALKYAPGPILMGLRINALPMAPRALAAGSARVVPAAAGPVPASCGGTAGREGNDGRAGNAGCVVVRFH
ncbi:ATP-binding protein [Streptomyces canus]|uniref:ATP-binding protein n=1 Tax=Streptomyces canus TaxID=58343 RepID=UPI0033D0432D